MSIVVAPYLYSLADAVVIVERPIGVVNRQQRASRSVLTGEESAYAVL